MNRNHLDPAHAQRLAWSLAVLLLITGCAASPGGVGKGSSPMVNESLTLLETELDSSAASGEVPTPDNFLELPPELRDYLDRHVVPLPSEEQRFRALESWAFNEFQKNYEYDPGYTSPLGQLPESRRINCFSFSNLFVAAARYADVSANFQLVESPPEWDINNNTWVVSQHINVSGSVYRRLTQRERRILREQRENTGSLIKRIPPTAMDSAYVIDLNPEIAVDAYRSQVISDQAALALFYSNRSVEELLAANHTAAVEYGQLAIQADSESVTAWTNLGVLLSRQGKDEEARQAYLTALALDPNSESAANNLERSYRRSGDAEKAEAMAASIRSNREKNPYYHYALGEKLLAEGEPKSAVQHFKKAIRKKENERLFYYGLVEAHITLGEYRKASKNLRLAKQHSTPRDQWRYDELSARLSRQAGEG